MSRFKKLSKTALSSWRPLLILAIALTFVGCFSDDDTRPSPTPKDQRPAGSVGAGNGADFHGAEFATIANLDPRGEECVDCHGLSNDMSPISGKSAHNIGLQKNTDHSAYADLKITGVKINEETGDVTVTLNKPIPAGAGNPSMTFAKLAPRVIHNRGHDWQNYFTSNALGRGGNEPASEWFQNGGVAPQTVPSPTISDNTITFNLGTGTGREFGTLADFTVKSAYEGDASHAGWTYTGIKGTKMKMGADLATHVYCDEAHANSNQTADSNDAKSVCWWPDGTHLTAGTFVTTDNEFVVEYNPDQTHRVTIILGSTAGNPGFNTWYDFVPSVANGAKTPSDFTSTDTTLTGSDYITPFTGQVISENYKVAEGRKAPGGIVADNDTEGHQSLPAARDVVDVQSCNSCHDGLTMHGGSGRSQTQTCVTCHNPGNLQASSGRSVDFKQLIHRVHRGVNLPSEDPSLANLMQDGNTLLAKDVKGKLSAGDFTKVRFPQGPRPGEAAGITNCVKCHMGEQTKGMVQGLADELGADNFDVQSKMKLAKVTPQGDNWLSVRSVNACQACHDSNVWFSADNINGVNKHRSEDGDKSPADPKYQLDKYMAFYSDKYADVGFDWLGKKLSRNNNDAGWIHNTGSPDGTKGRNDRFTCGSSGGCHGNPPLDDSVTPGGRAPTLGVLHPDVMPDVGNRQTNAIQQVHLELTRNFILAERFAIEISDAQVTAAGQFTATVQVKDKKTGNYLAVGDDLSTTIPTLASVTLPTGGQLAWMHKSPDYNHSPGSNGAGIPGNPLPVSISWNGNVGTATADLATMPRLSEWEKIKDDYQNVVGTVFVQGKVGTYNVQSQTLDFRFDGQSLAADEGRRKVVDFTAGNGPVNLDPNKHYPDWDKADGANTQSCSSCHLQLAYHSNNRTNNVQVCVVCHNSQRTDVNTGTRRGVLSDKDGQYEESLDFKRLIHAVHSAPNKRIDPMYVGTANSRPSQEGDPVRGHSFPGVISNCKSCHIEDENTGKWTFDLQQLPEGMIGSTAITADWSLLDPAVAGNANYDPDGKRHDFANHMKMSPIASVCSSCHDAGYKTTDGRMNDNNAPEGGPYIGSHWWMQGGIAPGIVAPGEKPKSTKHQSGK